MTLPGLRRDNRLSPGLVFSSSESSSGKTNPPTWRSIFLSLMLVFVLKETEAVTNDMNNSSYHVSWVFPYMLPSPLITSKRLTVLVFRSVVWIFLFCFVGFIFECVCFSFFFF